MNKEQARLEEIRKRADAATEGEWEQANKSVRVAASQEKHSYGKSAPTGYFGGICNCLGIRTGLSISQQVNTQATKNAEFIAHARQDIPYLLDLIESIQRERDERDNPKPLDFNQLKVGNPVWIAGLNRWELILGIDAEWMKIYLSNNKQLIYGSCDLYATEPKGDEARCD